MMIRAMLIGAVAVVGCGGDSSSPAAATTGKPTPKAGASTEAKPVAKAEPKKEVDHSGWWCDEHGVVEAECSMCQREVFKKLKPDEICKVHPDRAKAQCFICNPELREKHAAVYRAKYDKDPPEPDGNMPEKKR